MMTTNGEKNPVSGKTPYQQLLEATAKWGSEGALNKALNDSKKDNDKLPAELLAVEVAKYSLRCENVPGDGNCFYHAVADQLRRLGVSISGHPNQDHRKLREIVADHIINNLQLYRDANDMEPDQFISQVSTTSVWADDIHVTALSRALNITIVLVRSDGKPRTIIRRQPNPHFTVFLGYEVGIHYQSLVSITSGQNEALLTEISNADDNRGEYRILESAINIHGQWRKQLEERITAANIANINNDKKVKQVILDYLVAGIEAKENNERKHQLANLKTSEASNEEKVLAEKICQLSMDSVNYTKENYQFLSESFEKLGNIYLAKNSYIKAAGLYNMALGINRKHLKVETETIQRKLFDIEVKLLKDVPNAVQKLSYEEHQKQIEDYKGSLKKLRDNVSRKCKEIENSKDEKDRAERVEKIRSVFNYIAGGMKKFIKDVLLEGCYSTLGKLKCDYAIIGLGSLAKEEATPYSDLEFAILIGENQDTKENIDYFLNLTDLLHLKIINLGETIIPSLAIESLNPSYNNFDFQFFDNITPRGFAFDGAMPNACKTPRGKRDINGEIVYQLIQTPKNMAKFHGKKNVQQYWFDVEPYLTFALSNVTLIDGECQLVKDYKKYMWDELNQKFNANHTLGQHIAIWVMNENNKANVNLNLNNFSAQGSLFNAKKDLYRIPNLIIDALSIYGLVNCDNNSSWNRINQLTVNKLLDARAKGRLQWVLSETMYFRLETYLHYNAQKEQMNPLSHYLDNIEAQSASSKFNLIGNQTTTLLLDESQYNIGEANRAILTEIYQILISMHQYAVWFCQTNGKKNNFENNDLFVNSPEMLGLIALRFNQYNKAIQHFEEALKSKLEDHVIAGIHNQLGSAYQDAGDMNSAKKHYKKSLEMHSEHCNTNKYINDINMATSYNNLGLILVNSDPEKAVGLLKKAFEIDDAILKSANSDMRKEVAALNVARDYNSLGQAHYSSGEIWNAVNYFEKAISIYEKCVRKHPQTHMKAIYYYGNLARVLLDLDKIKLAMDNLEKALKIAINVYGLVNPIVMKLYNYFGSIWYLKNDTTKALNYFTKACNINQALNYQDHPETAVLYNNLSLALELIDPEKAKQFALMALRSNEKNYGCDHPEAIKNVIRLLTLCKDHVGDLIEAKRHADRILSAISKVSNVLEQARIYSVLGDFYKLIGEKTDAIKYAVYALKIDKENLNNNMHHLIAQDYSNLGVIYAAFKMNKEARENYKEALTIYRKDSQAKYLAIANTLSNLACVVNSLKEERKLLRKALTILEEKKINKSTILSGILTNLGVNYKFSQKLNDSVKFFERALKIEEEIYGEKNPRLVPLICALGSTYASLNNIKKVDSCYFQAYGILKINPRICNTEYADVYLKIGSYFESLDLLKFAMDCLYEAFCIYSAIYTNIDQRFINKKNECLVHLNELYKKIGASEADLFSNKYQKVICLLKPEANMTAKNSIKAARLEGKQFKL